MDPNTCSLHINGSQGVYLSLVLPFLCPLSHFDLSHPPCELEESGSAQFTLIWKTRWPGLKGPVQHVLPQPPIQCVFSKGGSCMLAQCYKKCSLLLQYGLGGIGYPSVPQVSHSSISSRGKSESLIWQCLIILIAQGTSKTSTVNHGCFKTINSSVFANSWGRKLIFPENTETDGSSVNARISLRILLTWNSFGQFRTSGVNMGDGNEKFLECI